MLPNDATEFVYDPHLPQAADYWKQPNAWIEYIVDPTTYFALVMHELSRNPRPNDKPPYKLSERLSHGYMRYRFTREQLERLVTVAANAHLLF